MKTNIGHTEAASGIASLMKAALALKHGQLPPSLHFQKPNPDIPFDRLPLRVLQKLESWPDAPHRPRLAGVSAFGFGGSNAHVVLEEAPEALNAGANRAEPRRFRPSPFALRFRRGPRARLRDLARRYVEFLGDNPPPWRDVCYTAAARRDHHDCRLAILAETPARGAAVVAGLSRWRRAAQYILRAKTIRTKSENRLCLRCWRGDMAELGHAACPVAFRFCFSSKNRR